MERLMGSQAKACGWILVALAMGLVTVLAAMAGGFTLRQTAGLAVLVAALFRPYDTGRMA